MCGTVSRLFVKRASGSPVESTPAISVSPDEGIIGGVTGPRLRQVLLVSRATLDRFRLNPGQLKENILINGCDVQQLQSGTVLNLGTARIKINFHCEVCHKIKDIVNTRQIQHQRGVLGTIITAGTIRVDDTVTDDGVHYDPVPYDIPERIRWYFSHFDEPIAATQLVEEIGLSQAYCRALPAYMKRVPEYSNKVIYKTKRAPRSSS